MDDSFQLALNHFNAGRHRLAEQLCATILETDPQRAEALNLHGAIAHQDGNVLRAIEYFRAAAASEAGNPAYLTNLGVAYMACGKLTEAVASYRQALLLNPDNAEAHNNLGIALQRQGLREEALACFREALGLQPDYPEAHNNLGIALYEHGKAAEAVASYRQALLFRPDYAEAHNNLGNALKAQHKVDEAVACYGKAVQLRPHYAEAFINLGNAFKVQGKVGQAIASYQQALRLNPNSAQSYYNLGQFVAQGHHRFTPDEIERLIALSAHEGVASEDRCQFAFAVGDVLDKLGAYDEAFVHYQQGNRLKRWSAVQRGADFSASSHRHLVDRLIATFDRAYFQPAAAFGVNTDLPVFVVGVPRSGTTLVTQILSSHPQMASAGELGDIPGIAVSLKEKLAAIASYPDCLSRLTLQAASACAARYLRRLTEGAGNALRIVDKLPENFLHLGLIATLFPQARVIHCRREPLDTCLSCYFQNFHGLEFASSLEDLGAYYLQYERLMAHWRAVLPLRVLEVRYEELVAEPEDQMRRLVAFCGLEWSDSCLRFYENGQVVQTASTLQVRQPIYTSSVGRWKRYELHVQPLLKILQP